MPLAFVLGSHPGSAAALARAAAVVGPLYFFVERLARRGRDCALDPGAAGACLAPQLPVECTELPCRRGTRGGGDHGGDTRAFGWLDPARAAAVSRFRSYHTVVGRLREEQDETRRAMEVQLATVEALALAIEAKAGFDAEHIQSIQQYAAVLAEASGLSEAEVQGVRTAALLHDIGNMAVPEHILAKPTPLTPQEFERIKNHPRVGAEILRNVPFGAPVADMVLCHHERWDGLGYPAGLRGNAIPIGARILAIADCYSTMQSDRPYRPARNEAAAIAALRKRRARHSTRRSSICWWRGCIAPIGTARQSPRGEDAWAQGEGMVALQDIARTHREEQILYEIAQALGSSLGVADAMALVGEKVRRLVPFVTCALFLGDEEQGYVCRYAHGPGTEALLNWAPRSWSEIALSLPPCADGRGIHGEELAAMLPCPLTFEERSSAASRSITPCPDTSPTSTAGCSGA